jgi:hypothetical protein
LNPGLNIYDRIYYNIIGYSIIGMSGPILIHPSGPIYISLNNPISFTLTTTIPIDNITGYQWKKNGIDIVGATLSTYSVPFAQLSDSGIYTLGITYKYSILDDCNIATTYDNQYASSPGTDVIVQNMTDEPIIIIEPPGPIIISSNTPIFLNPTIILPYREYVEYIITGYQWKKNGDDIDCATLRTYTVPFAHVSDSGIYTLCLTYMYSLIIDCKLVSTYGYTCSPSGTVITVLDPIVIISYVSDRYIVPTTPPNNNFTLTVIATGSSPVYTWYTPPNHTGIITGSNTYPVNPALIINQGNYYVTVSNSISSATSSIIYIDIVEPPQIIIQPLSPQNIVVGQPVTFSVTASGEYLDYQWKKNEMPIIDAISPVYTIAVTELTDTGSYTVCVSNIAGTVISNPAILKVYPVTTISTLIITIDTTLFEVDPNTVIKVCDGSSVFLYVIMADPAYVIDYTFVWKKNGIPVSVQPNSPIYLVDDHVTILDTGEYTVTVKSPADTIGVTSVIAHIVVLAIPIIVSGPLPVTQLVRICENIQLSIFATGGCLEYQWRHNGVNIEGATNSIFITKYIDQSYSGEYDVIITNTKGTVTSSIAYVYFTLTHENVAASASAIIGASIGANMASGITDAKIRAAARCAVSPNQITSCNEQYCCPSGPIIPLGRGGTIPSALIQQQIQRQLTCNEAANKALILQRQSVPACPAVDLRFVKYQRRGPIAVPMPPPPGVIIPSNPGVPTAVNGPCVNVIGISTTRF